MFITNRSFDSKIFVQPPHMTPIGPYDVVLRRVQFSFIELLVPSFCLNNFFVRVSVLGL